MTRPGYDVIVVGVGGMGSAAAFHLAARGLRVLALERQALGHALGSSHGLTRIIRLAYFEHPSYVPLLHRAFALWRELERGLDEPLLHVTGSLDVGRVGSDVFDGSLRSCREHGLAHETLDAKALRTRFPGWQPTPDMMAVYQPDGGFLTPERCIATHVARAAALGATIRERESVLEWKAGGGMVTVRTDRAIYDAGQLVLAAGPWMGQLTPDLRARLVPERQVVGWFDIAEPSHFTPHAFPVFVLDADEGRYYGFPEYGVRGSRSADIITGTRSLTRTQSIGCVTPPTKRRCARPSRATSPLPMARCAHRVRASSPTRRTSTSSSTVRRARPRYCSCRPVPVTGSSSPA